MVRLTLGFVADAVRGRLTSGDSELELGDVVTDTRTLQRGDLFVALQGPRFDGNAFVADAFAKGASRSFGLVRPLPRVREARWSPVRPAGP
jgi:UDP-N-acetylmuramoyl-tripeptide--D-alanyl-D-alanine ligase